jgi:hypothetical protein
MRRRSLFWICLPLLLCSGGWLAAAATQSTGCPPRQPWFPKAPPLPKPAGETIRAATVAELFRAAKDVKPGGTILVADGHYPLPRFLELHTDNVTLRSESGRRDSVVIDGSGRLGELIWISRCSGVTIADLTIQNVKWNGFKLNSDHGVTKVRIYNCVIHNIWQRGIKGVMVPEKDRDKLRPTDCRVEYCLFYNDHPKQPGDDDSDTFGGNYVGGMDIMYAKRWTISDNVFVAIHGRTGEGRGAIFLWVDAEDCTVERNAIIDCDCGICLGNSYRGEGTTAHCIRCIVRNNFVTRCPENDIFAGYTRDCQILHNTVFDPRSRYQRLIRLVNDNDGLVVANNLLVGRAMQVESKSTMRIEGNVIKDATPWLVDPTAGNLHLRPSALGALGTVKRLPEVAEDIDRQLRPPATVVGAHQPANDR